MAKYDSPTANLYALLAVEDEHSQTRTAKAAAKSKEQEMTPKERAEAKAVQEAERRAKKEAAEKAKREAEERKKAIEALNIDDTGFAPQRHQRIKEGRTGAPQPPAEAQKPKGQNRQGKSDGSGKTEKFGNKGGQPFNKSFDKGGKQEGKGNKEGKTFNKGQGDNRPRVREFDKHSQGVVSRKPGAKKGGAGKGNWDNTAKSVPTGTTAEEAASSPSIAATTEPDVWDNVQDATPTDAEAKPAEGEAAAATPAEGADKKEDESGEDEMTLEEYQVIQAKKKEELAAKLGGVTAAQPRALSEEETRALAKFTLVENAKSQKPAAKPAASTSSSATPAARKPAKQVLEINVAHPPRAGTRGGKGRFNGNRGERDQRDQNREKKGRVAKPAKLPRGGNFDSQFPSLG